MILRTYTAVTGLLKITRKNLNQQNFRNRYCEAHTGHITKPLNSYINNISHCFNRINTYQPRVVILTICFYALYLQNLEKG